MLKNLLEKCFPGLVTNEYKDNPEEFHEQFTEEFHFVIPREDYKRFSEIRPQNGTILTVSQFMFLYKYFTLTKNSEEPAPDYERMFYFFRDRSSVYLLKSWVPCRSCQDQASNPGRNFLTRNINNNLEILKENDTKEVYVTAGNVPSAASKVPTNISKGACHNVSELEFESDSRMLPTIFTAVPQRKSTYNWGIINTWSRHMAPESEDHAPLDLFKSSGKAVIQTDSVMDQLYELNKDILKVIEGKPAGPGNVSRKYNRSSGMLLSTLDARENRLLSRHTKDKKRPHKRNFYSIL